MPSLYQILMTVLLVLGFGFVIFWHELGHFLAAKWVGIKVEQFAVGFGQAVFSWRKGVGFRAGNTQKDYRDRIEAYLAESRKGQLSGSHPEYSEPEQAQAAAALGLGETEYRLNWIPLGGYVKMLGQDDLRPDALAEDPRAFNRKSVGARMIVISAGVIMNVILAALLYIAVFLIGLKAPPAYIGNLASNSPALRAGLRVGDHIKTFNGKSEEDFTKITLDTALAQPEVAVPMVVEREVNGKTEEVALTITPGRPDGTKGFVALGFEAPVFLESEKPAAGEPVPDLKTLEKQYPAESLLLRPGDSIVAINGTLIDPKKDYAKFDEACQQFGKTVELVIHRADGQNDSVKFQPHFAPNFAGPVNFAGMQPRARVNGVLEQSSAFGKLRGGDVITRVVVHGSGGNDEVVSSPSVKALMELFSQAGASGQPFDVSGVHEDGSVFTIPGLTASAPVGDQRGQRGLGVVLGFDERHAVLGDVLPDSAAAKVGLAAGDEISAIDGEGIETWYDIHRRLGAMKPGEVHVTYVRNGQAGDKVMKLEEAQIASIAGVRYDFQRFLSLTPYIIVRKAPNAWVAIKWGTIETRDAILQFYLTLQRMFGGSVSLSNMMGPVGIFRGGVRFAVRGTDWLIWFLAMISANLAVVNFLPIPVVDGGQFVFLLLEKAKGKPVSPKTMAIAQYVGLAFLAAVVVFVTYHDILRRY